AHDDSAGYRFIRLLDENGDELRTLGGRYRTDTYSIPYTVPADMNRAELGLRVIASDPSGNSTTANLTLPLQPNEPPQALMSRFASYRVNGAYQKILTRPERLAPAEFFVRSGETFQVDFQLSDDAGLQH